MTEYTVTWEINLDADTPEEAAKLALKIQRDPESMATWFHVENTKNNEMTKLNIGID